MSLEYVTHGTFLDKSNVYSFGVIMLKMVRKLSYIYPERDVSLEEYVSRLYLFSLG